MKILMAGRGAGKTYQLVQMVKGDPHGVLVVRDIRTATEVKSTYGVEAVSVRQVMALRGVVPVPNLYVDGWDMLKSARDLLGFPVVAVAIDQENDFNDLLRQANPHVKDGWTEIDLGKRLRVSKAELLAGALLGDHRMKQLDHYGLKVVEK